MDLLSKYNINLNTDKKQWMFEPLGNWIGYTISLSEADTEADAWISIYLAEKLRLERLNTNLNLNLNK